MMDRIRIDVVTDDSEYGRALAEALRYRSRAFNVNIRGCDEYIAEWKMRGRALRYESDLILWDGEEGECICGGNIVWINERCVSGEEEQPEEEHRPDVGYSISRYDTASAIHARLLDIYRNLTGREVRDRGCGDVRVIAFASWQGGSGCTTVCRAVGQELTRFYGKKVMILTFDSFGSGAGPQDPEDRVFSVDAFLYRLFHRRDEMNAEQFLTRDGYGMASLRPSCGRNPLPYLSEEEGEELMSYIADHGGFDCVLIDVGDCFSDGAAACIAFADRICLIERRTETGREERYMTCLKHAAEDAGLIKVINGCACGEGGEDAEAEERAGDGRMDLMASLRLAERREASEEILLEGEFGNNIHELTEHLWYNENN